MKNIQMESLCSKIPWNPGCDPRPEEEEPDCVEARPAQHCQAQRGGGGESQVSIFKIFRNVFYNFYISFPNPIFLIRRYLKDFFSSVLDLAWIHTLLGFAASFLLSWLIFAAFWLEYV